MARKKHKAKPMQETKSVQCVRQPLNIRNLRHIGIIDIPMGNQAREKDIAEQQYHLAVALASRYRDRTKRPEFPLPESGEIESDALPCFSFQNSLEDSRSAPISVGRFDIPMVVRAKSKSEPKFPSPAKRGRREGVSSKRKSTVQHAQQPQYLVPC